MADYLEELCKRWDIKLVYTGNKFVVLSCTTPQDEPNLRAHRLFRGCPKKVASAVLRWCIGTGSQRDRELIEHYVRQDSDKDDFEIKEPDARFLALLDENLSKGQIPDDDGESNGGKLLPVPVSAGQQTGDALSEAERSAAAARQESTLEVHLAFSLFLTLAGVLGMLTAAYGLVIPAPLDNTWIQLTLATPVQLISGCYLITGFAGESSQQGAKIGSVFGLAAAAAYCWSAAALVGAVTGPVVFAASYVVITAVLLGRFVALRLWPLIYRLAVRIARDWEPDSYPVRKGHVGESGATSRSGSSGADVADRSRPPTPVQIPDCAPEQLPGVEPSHASPAPEELMEMQIMAIREQGSESGGRLLSFRDGITPTEDQVTTVEVVVDHDVEDEGKR